MTRAHLCGASAETNVVKRLPRGRGFPAHVYAQVWKDAALAHLVDVAVFCDSDDTHTASISYFAYVRLERR